VQWGIEVGLVCRDCLIPAERKLRVERLAACSVTPFTARPHECLLLGIAGRGLLGGGPGQGGYLEPAGIVSCGGVGGGGGDGVVVCYVYLARGFSSREAID